MLYKDEKIVTLIGRTTEVEFSEIERKVMRAMFEIFIFILRKQWKPGETCITDFEKTFANAHAELHFSINFYDIYANRDVQLFSNRVHQKVLDLEQF